MMILHLTHQRDFCKEPYCTTLCGKKEVAIFCCATEDFNRELEEECFDICHECDENYDQPHAPNTTASCKCLGGCSICCSCSKCSPPTPKTRKMFIEERVRYARDLLNLGGARLNFLTQNEVKELILKAINILDGFEEINK